MSPAEFWDLTWYDWGLYLLRAQREGERQKAEYELSWIPWRELYALLCNINRDRKEKPTPFKGTDFIKFDFDKVASDDERLSIKEPDLEGIKSKYTRIKKANKLKRVNGSK